MSAGSFIFSRYEADYLSGTAIHPIRVQPETVAAVGGGVQNSAPSAPVTNPISARANGSRRGIGLTARTVRIRFPATGQPTGYQASGTTRIPALNKAFWTACTKGTTVTYLGAECTVVGRSVELAA